MLAKSFSLKKIKENNISFISRDITFLGTYNIATPNRAEQAVKSSVECTILGGSFLLKFIYSEKATKFCEIFILLLSYVVPVKSKVKISQNCVAFSEYMNFKDTFLSEGTVVIT